MPIYLHLVRHAQGYHNLSAANHTLPDPDLTPLGKEQCAALRRAFPLHDKVTYLVASPMRRTLYTCLYAFGDDDADGTTTTDDVNKTEKKKKKGKMSKIMKSRETIFATVYRIARTEGVRALYDGIGGELLKAFFSHGITMLSKDVIHGLIVRLYFAIVAALKEYPRIRGVWRRRTRGAREDLRSAYLQAWLALERGTMEVRQEGFSGFWK